MKTLLCSSTANGWHLDGHICYIKTMDKNMLQPAEQVENNILLTSRDIVNINIIKMDIYFFHAAIYMSSYWTDLAVIYMNFLFVICMT